MKSMKALLYIGACMNAWSMTTSNPPAPTAQNVHWVSLDFKTVLTWTVEESNHSYTVLYASGLDWTEAPDCIETSASECDLTHHLIPLNKDYEADIRTESDEFSYIYGEDFDNPHTYAPNFNPYKESNISALEFSLEDVNKSTVILNIKPLLTSIHERGKQMTIEDILADELKYKISYYKTGSTGKREKISDSSRAEVSGLDAGQGYCFTVAAFIPSRPKANQHGAWSTQLCTQGDFSQELSLGAWVGIVFLLIILLITFITATVLCCRRKHQRHKTLQTSQSSVPV